MLSVGPDSVFVATVAIASVGLVAYLKGFYDGLGRRRRDLEEGPP